MSRACVRPLPRSQSMPNRYVRFPHTATNNSNLLPLCSIASGFLHFMSCVFIRSLPKLHSMPDKYNILPHTTNDNSHLLPLCSVPNCSLHCMLCACIRSFPDPHSMPNSYMIYETPSFQQFNKWLSAYIFFYMCACIRHMLKLHSLLSFILQYCSCACIRHLPKQTLHPVVVFLYQKFSIYSLLSYFYSRIRERNIDFLSFSFFLFYLFIFFFFFLKYQYLKRELGD